MLRNRLLAAATLFVAVAAGSSYAVFDAEAFALLKSILETHRDSDFSGTLDKTLKKQKAAVTKSLALIEKPATAYSKDAATALKVLKLLLKAYPNEFVVAPPKAATFGDAYDGLLYDIYNQVTAQRDALSARTPNLPGSAGVKVHNLVGKIDAALAAVANGELPLKVRAAKLVTAAKLAETAAKIADKASGTGGPGLSAMVDSMNWKADSAQSEFYTGDNTLQIYGSRVAGGVREAIYLLVTGVTGPGTYSLTGANARGNFQSVVQSPISSTIYDLTSGSVTVQILQTGATKRVKCTFSYTATHAMAGTKTITSGSHDVSGSDVIIYSTNGF